MNSIVYEIPEMNQVEVVVDLIYKVENQRKYSFDICYPLQMDRNKMYPTVILINGGSGASLKLNNHFRECFLSWGRLLACSNLLTVHFNWNYKKPSDIVDLISYLRSHSDELNIDSDCISTFSFSRGVKLSVNQVLSVNNGFIKGMVVYYGKLPDTLLYPFSNQWPPMFIVMAANDSFFQPDCNDEVIERNLNGATIVKAIHETGEHAFDIRNQNARSVELIQQTVAFLKNTLTS